MHILAIARLSSVAISVSDTRSQGWLSAGCSVSIKVLACLNLHMPFSRKEFREESRYVVDSTVTPSSDSKFNIVGYIVGRNIELRFVIKTFAPKLAPKISKNVPEQLGDEGPVTAPK